MCVETLEKNNRSGCENFTGAYRRVVFCEELGEIANRVIEIIIGADQSAILCSLLTDSIPPHI